MQINKKQIIILVILIIIILLTFLIIFFKKPKQEIIKPEDQIPPQQVMEEPKKEEFNSLEFESNAKIDENSLVIETARNFIERYGSWSNQTEDFYELISPMITDHMYSQAKNYISSNANFSDNKNYYGITTKLINATILELDNNSALVSLQLQQIESKNGEEATFYKKVDLSLVFVNDKWLVDSVSWK
jgi:hypothetical protein